MIAMLYIFYIVLMAYIWAVDANSTTGSNQVLFQRQGWTPQPNGRGTLDIL